MAVSGNVASNWTDMHLSNSCKAIAETSNVLDCETLWGTLFASTFDNPRIAAVVQSWKNEAIIKPVCKAPPFLHTSCLRKIEPFTRRSPDQAIFRMDLSRSISESIEKLFFS